MAAAMAARAACCELAQISEFADAVLVSGIVTEKDARSDRDWFADRPGRLQQCRSAGVVLDRWRAFGVELRRRGWLQRLDWDLALEATDLLREPY